MLLLPTRVAERAVDMLPRDVGDGRPAIGRDVAVDDDEELFLGTFRRRGSRSSSSLR